MDWIAAAEQLINSGLPRSALSLLQSSPLHGQRINRLRSLARTLSQTHGIRPGIYALAAHEDLGVVVPILAAHEGHGHRENRLGTKTSRAVRNAATSAKRLMEATTSPLPDFPVLTVTGVSLSGDSIGLAAALALLVRWSGQEPDRPVLATGCVTHEGHVLPVDRIRAKLEAAELELAGIGGIILVPAGSEENPCRMGIQACSVKTLEEAVRQVWGRSRLAADLRILSLREVLKRVENEPDHVKAMAMLESYPLEGLAPADRARVLLQTGVIHRHMGQTARAIEFQEKTQECLREDVDALGAESIELIEVQSFASSLDEFDFQGLESLLRNRLNAPFASPHNLVRCRGILAQVLSTVACAQESVRLRQDNLVLQEKSDEMRREIPRTLCSLVFEAARAGKGDVFDSHVPLLLERTPLGDAKQHAYNSFGIARGLVCLGRCADLVLWARGRKRLWDAPPPDPLANMLDTPGEISGYPTVGTARALVRALRVSGSPELAVDLAGRTHPAPGSGLIQWLSLLTMAEGALAEHEAGSREHAAARLCTLVPGLKTLHPQAAAFHGSLISLMEASDLESDENLERIERELDRVYY